MLIRYLLLLLLLGLAAGCTSPEARIERLCADARAAILRGDFAAALRQLDDAEAQSHEPASRSGWTISLLRAETFIVRRDLPAGLAVLQELPLVRQSMPDLEARRTYLRALAQLFQGAIQQATTSLEDARHQAEGASAEEVLLDIDTLHGQMLLRRERWSEASSVLNDVVTRASARRDTYRVAVARHNLGLACST
jgi:hypothetical protein